MKSTHVKLDYDEISPVSGRKSVLVESLNDGGDDYIKICMDSGYHTYSRLRDGTEDVKVFEENLPDLIRNRKLVDDDGFCWYLLTYSTENASLFPCPDEVDSYIWTVVPYKIVDNEVQYVFEEMFNYSRHLFEKAFDKLCEMSNLVNQLEMIEGSTKSEEEE